jgi:hypothetical protein
MCAYMFVARHTAGLVILSSLSMLSSAENVGKRRCSLRNVEVNADEDSLALELEVGDAKLGRERHFMELLDGLVWSVWRIRKESNRNG